MSAENMDQLGGQSSTAALRRKNRETLINLIGQQGVLTRGQLAEETGLTTAAISRITREMLDAGLLIENPSDEPPGRVGRRETLLSINPTGAFVLAVSLTANRRSVTLANALGGPVSTFDCDDLDPSSPLEFLGSLAARAKSLIYDADFNRSRLLGVGVAAAISSGGGKAGRTDLVTSNPLGWRDVPVRAILTEALQLPVRVEHRATAILRAELKPRIAPGDIYLVNVALGIGVSAYLDGRLIASGSPGFGTLSHFSLPNEATPCDCGRCGCLEVTASGRAILQKLDYASPSLAQQASRLNQAVLAADSKNPAATEAFREAGRRLGSGIDAVIALFNPHTVILSGEIGRQSDYFAGLIEGLEAAGRSNASTIVERSTIKSADAAISVALQEFVFTGELNFKKLKAA
ncbi:MAG: ROK family protein [Hyphomicrobiaceae bacterium]